MYVVKVTHPVWPALHDGAIKWKHFPRYWPFVCSEFTGDRLILHPRPMTQNFDVFYDLRLNQQLSIQSWGSWFETLSSSL